MKPIRLRLVLIATACDLVLWILVAFFSTSEFYRRAIVLGAAPEWKDVLVVQVVTSLNWAFFTPLILMIAQALPLRPPHRVRNLLIILALIPILAVIRAAFGGAVLDLGEGHAVSRHMVTLSIAIRTHRYSAIIAAIFFVYNFVDIEREASKRERQRVGVQTELARSELDQLRTRLQPRFALRMLRHIAGVLRETPAAADELIVTLGGILRRSMGRESDERIPLADELEHLDRCLELCRAGGRVAVNARYVAGDDVLACRVPAHALQPLIESVVLDLTSGDGGAVEVRCTRDGGDVFIEAGAAMLRIPCEEAPA